MARPPWMVARSFSSSRLEILAAKARSLHVFPAVGLIHYGDTMRAIVPALSLALASLACTAEPAPGHNPATVRASLDSILTAHAEHFRAADVDGLVGAYSANTVVRPAGMAPVRGIEALRSAAAEWIEAAPVKSLAYVTEDLSVFGDTAFHVASFTGTVQPKGSADMDVQGSCALLWVHGGRDGWKIERSLCNSGPAPARP